MTGCHCLSLRHSSVHSRILMPKFCRLCQLQQDLKLKTCLALWYVRWVRSWGISRLEPALNQAAQLLMPGAAVVIKAYLPSSQEWGLRDVPASNPCAPCPPLAAGKRRGCKSGRMPNSLHQAPIYHTPWRVPHKIGWCPSLAWWKSLLEISKHKAAAPCAPCVSNAPLLAASMSHLPLCWS